MKYKDPVSDREISEPTDYLADPEPRPSIWKEDVCATPENCSGT